MEAYRDKLPCKCSAAVAPRLILTFFPPFPIESQQGWVLPAIAHLPRKAQFSIGNSILIRFYLLQKYQNSNNSWT